MRHQFDQEFVIDASATTATFGLTATPWDEVVRRDGGCGAGDRAEPAGRAVITVGPWFLPGSWSPWRRWPRSPAATAPSGSPAGRGGRGDERSHRAAGARHRRRPQRPGGLRGAALGPPAAGRVARRGVRRPAPRGDHRFGQWIRFSHDGRGFLAYESRTWRLTDDGAIVGPDVRESGFWRPRGQDDVELLVTSPDGLVELYVGTRPDDDELGADHRRPGPHPRRARRHPGRPALRHRRRRADVRDRPRRARRAAAATDVRPTRTDPMTTSHRHAPRARSPTRYVDAVCDLDPIVATSLGTRPGDDRLPDPSPAGLEAEAALTRDDAGRAGPGARRGPGAGRRPGRAAAAPGCCASGSAPSSPRTRRARACGRCRTCSARCTRSARSSADAGGDRRGLGRHRPPHGAGAGGVPRLPGDASRRARAAGCSSRRARCAPSSPSSTSGWPARTSPASSPTGPEALRDRARRRPRAPPTRRSPRSATSCATSTRPLTEGTPDAVGRERYAARRAPLDRLRPRRRAAASRRPTPGAGRSTGGSWPSSASRPRRCCPGATPMEAMRWLAHATARRSRAWRRSAPGCRR